MKLLLILLPLLTLSATRSEVLGESKIKEKVLASWYGKKHHGRLTASGERFDMYALTAAHPTLAFNKKITLKSSTGLMVTVRINDRGPYAKKLIKGKFRKLNIDLSYAAAQQLGIIYKGIDELEIVAID